MLKTEPFTFEAEIRQVKSMADHSVNVTLNLPEYVDASWFLKRIGALVDVAVAENNVSTVQ
jgi:hypothetical protein